MSVLPWPTAVLAEYVREGTAADQRVAVLLYGVTSSLMAVGFQFLWRDILRHDELRRPEVTRAGLAVRNRRFTIGLGVHPAATLLGLIGVPLLLGLMFALAVPYLLPTPDVRGAGAPHPQ
ncbi:MAG: hypothetical protein JWQ26_3026 [Modestobacter sp.]|nr:hypothetical protein [Modestobacter sp.]